MRVRRGGLQLLCVLATVASTACGSSSSSSPAMPSTPSAPGTLTAVSVIAPAASPSVGQTLQLTATASFSNGTTQNVTSQATWTSSAPAVAQVSSSGAVTALTAGNVEIQASYQGMLGRTTLVVPIAGRNTGDRADDLAGYQVKIMYVLPSEGVDQALDVNNTLAQSVETFQNWLQQQGGVRLRMDTFGGALDIGFVRLPETNANLSASGLFLRDRIESDLRATVFNNPSKIYAVYFGGGTSATTACGGGPWPPTLVGHVAALYLLGQPPSAPPCGNNRFANGTPGYLEYSMIHEIFHALGVVPNCAPHQTQAGHVSDSPSDLMYAGSLPWTPSILDLGRDDYFNTGRTDCLDAAKSVFMTPTAPGATPPPGW